MIRTLLESIQEAATSILANTKTLYSQEMLDTYDQAELQKIDTALWEMVETSA